MTGKPGLLLPNGKGLEKNWVIEGRLGIEERLRRLEDEVNEFQAKQKSAIRRQQERAHIKSISLMALGCVSGLAGCAIVCLLGLMKFNSGSQKNFANEEYASGHNYFPGTVSEMVHDLLETTTGKCFFAFGNLCALSLLMSWYPWHLSNVHVWKGPKTEVWGPLTARVLLLMRHISLPVLLFLVVNIPVVPAPQRSQRDNIAEQVHSWSSIFMLASYFVAECVTLRTLRICDREKDRRQWYIRCATIILGLVASVLFMASGWLLSDGALKQLNLNEYGDKWQDLDPSKLGRITFAKNYTYVVQLMQNIESPHLTRKMLLNTATHPVLCFKWIQFASETLAVTFVLLNMSTICWYSTDLPHLEKHIWSDDGAESSSEDEEFKPM